VSIDMATEEAFFASVREVVQAKWGSSLFEDELDRGHGRSRCIVGVFGDVDLEIRAFFSGAGPTVRATCGLARFVPKSSSLVVELNSENRRVPLVTFGIADEPDEPGTVRVVTSASVLDGFITPVAVRQTVENSAWPPNVLLARGFLQRHVGRLSLAVFLDFLADAASRTGLGPADRLRGRARELDARVNAGTIGSIPNL
jgi:hypothetical protein